jgi:Gram-negative porin
VQRMFLGAITCIFLMFSLSLAEEVQPNPVAAGTNNVSLSLSGQVNRALLYIYDGEQSDLFNVDSEVSSTRFRIVGDYQSHAEFSIGAIIEVEMESNSSVNVSQDRKTDADPVNFTERKLEIYFDSKTYGRLWLGQGNTASDGTSEVDLSGTGYIAYSSPCDWAGGIQFRTSDTAMLTGITLCDVFDNLDGLSRDDRIRYDTPVMAGFKLSTSWVTDDRWDVALRYGGNFGAIKAAAAMAYSKRPEPFEYQINGSFSVWHESGVSFTLATGIRKVDASNDPKYVYFKLSYARAIWKLGDSNIGVDLYLGNDVGARGNDSVSFSGFVVQNLDAYATAIYAGIRQYELDQDGPNLDGVFAFFTGARVKF